MNDPVFASMRSQMTPSPKARGELADKLAQAVPGKPVFRKRFAAVAACAALALCIYPAYNAMRPAPKLHDYVTVEGSGTLAEKAIGTVTGSGPDEGSMGDRDQAMTPGELTEAMEAVGFSTADIDAYQDMGYEMTWAKWWKFVNEQKNVEGEEPFNLTSLKEFSRKELFVNTGLADELPGGAYVPGGDDPVAGLPSQPGADAYQLLMDHFGDTLPDWYGGAYVTSRGTLMVLLVADKDPGDKSLEQEVLEAAGGRTAPVGFVGAKYSRNDLDRLNREILGLLEGKGISASWGIYDDQNRIVLDTDEVLPDEVLAKLAQLDPDGDAILVRVVTGNAVVTDEQVKGPMPVVPGGVQEAPPHSGAVGEDPAVHAATEPGATAPSDGDLKAIEPQSEELPVPEGKSGTESGQSVRYELPSVDTKGKE